MATDHTKQHTIPKELLPNPTRLLFFPMALFGEWNVPARTPGRRRGIQCSSWKAWFGRQEWLCPHGAADYREHAVAACVTQTPNG
mmetsp:Transcript_115364/g.235864  ORF Transcript_115364/g.235864 Transcript_115364/m.235864 type:complete len:85 (+) Transcript_115364:1188-1442(+)